MKANQRKIRGYRDLLVWQRAMALVPEVYRLIGMLPSEERFAMGDQLRRATISIPANIAEGQARHHPREFRQHMSIARGSLAELDTLLTAAQSLGYLPEEALRPLRETIVDIRCMLFGLMRRLNLRLHRERTNGSGATVDYGLLSTVYCLPSADYRLPTIVFLTTVYRLPSLQSR